MLSFLTNETRHFSLNLTQKLKDKESITIGRAPFCNIIFPYPAISKEHARITRQGDDYFAEDLDSKYGTFVNGERLNSQKQKLKNNDELSLAEIKQGDYALKLIFRIE